MVKIKQAVSRVDEMQWYINKVKLTNQANCVETNQRTGICSNEWHIEIYYVFISNSIIRKLLRFIKCEDEVLRKLLCSIYTAVVGRESKCNV